MGFAKNKRSSPAAAAPRAAPARNFGSQAKAPPPMPAAQPAMPPAAAASAGSGMMGTMASSMAGSVAGNMIANQMFGGRSGEAPAAAAAAPVASAVPAACQLETAQFMQCMTNTNDNIEQCSAFYDMFKQCNAQAQ